MIRQFCALANQHSLLIMEKDHPARRLAGRADRWSTALPCYRIAGRCWP